MPLRSRIVAAECIEQYISTGESHLQSGFNLLIAQDANGVKLLGESFEMFLKAIYFSYVKSTDLDPIDRADLSAAKVAAIGFQISEQPRSYHNLLFWTELVIAQRSRVLSHLMHPTAEELQVRNAARRMSLNWDITDRYKNIQTIATSQDMNEAFEDAMLIWKLTPVLRK